MIGYLKCTTIVLLGNVFQDEQIVNFIQFLFQFIHSFILIISFSFPTVFFPYKYASYRFRFRFVLSTIVQYWPTILNKKFDFNNNELSVTLIQEEILSNNTSSSSMIIMRTFQIHPNDLIVRQFHLKNFSVGDDGTTSGGGGGCSTTKILSTKTSSTSTIRSCYELIELREKLDQYSSITSSSSSATSSSSHPLVVQCM